MVLAIGTFAIGTDAFVIGGVLPAVARSLGVSTSSAGLLVTAFAVAYALGAPILAVASARLARRALLVLALTVFVAASVLAAVAPTYALVLIDALWPASASPRRSGRSWPPVPLGHGLPQRPGPDPPMPASPGSPYTAATN
jgi:DHA1 family inner membrane transport protein